MKVSKTGQKPLQDTLFLTKYYLEIQKEGKKILLEQQNTSKNWVLHLIPNGKIKNSQQFKSWFFFFSSLRGRKNEIGNGEITVICIQRTRYHGCVIFGPNHLDGTKADTKLSQLNVNICPKYIFALSSVREAHYFFPPAFLACHMTSERPIPALFEVFCTLGGRTGLQLSGPEAFFHLVIHLCFSVLGEDWEALSGRKERSPVGEGQAPKMGNIQVTAHTF